jgi:hypothetical protein
VVREVGRAGWYLTRSGFWHGAIGPAACWGGAAAAIVDAAPTANDPFRDAARGDLHAQEHLVCTLLRAAGDGTDADPGNGPAARRRALATRHLVERACHQIVDRFSQAFGPRPFTADASLGQRVADLHLYLRQHHGDRDLAELGRLEGSR